MTNIGGQIEDEQILTQRTFPFITNLEPAKIMGVMSEAMIMVPSDENGIDVTTTAVGKSLM